MWNFNLYENNLALYTEEKEFNYKTLQRLQKEFGSKIDERSLLIICMENVLECLIAYISCVQNKHVPLLLPDNSNLNYLQSMIDSYAPNYVVTRENYIDNYEIILESNGIKLWRAVKMKNISLNSDLALLLPTSGTTCNSKVVRISYDNLKSNTHSICMYMNLDEQDRAITSLPLSYTFGLSIINTIFMVGGSIVLTNYGVMQKEFWDYIKNYNVTILAGVPYTYLCMKKIGINLGRFNKLRMLLQAGGRLPNMLQEYWGRQSEIHQKCFLVMYGQTEATARISYLPSEKCLEKIGSVGIAIPNTKILLVDENGILIKEPRQLGEIISVGEHVSFGYSESYMDLCKGNLRNHFLKTGDLGYFDEDSYLYITGRKSRIAKIFGKRVQLDDLEYIIEKNLQTEVAVVSDDEKIYVVSETVLSDHQKEKIIKKLDLTNSVLKYVCIARLIRKENGKKDYNKMLNILKNNDDL